MDESLVFVLKSVISSGILFGYYCAVLRNRKFHQYNRFYLLCTLIISIVLPFLNFSLFSFQQRALTDLTFSLYQPVSINTKQVHTSFGWLNILIMVSVSITAIMLLLLV